MDGQTLMITTRVDWNNVGFASGSRTVDDDWKLWNRLVISLDNAKLLRNKTCRVFDERSFYYCGQHAHQVRNCCIEED